jgi:hypothetical protein
MLALSLPKTSSGVTGCDRWASGRRDVRVLGQAPAPVNALRAQASELAQILEAGTELQTQMYELSKALGTANDAATSAR